MLPGRFEFLHFKYIWYLLSLFTKFFYFIHLFIYLFYALWIEVEIILTLSSLGIF